MLFSSYAFLFVFLPIALVGYQIAGHFHRKAVILWLGLASLGFYAYWHPPFLVVLLSSVLINYLAAGLIDQSRGNDAVSQRWLWLAICANLLALAYFKYFVPLLNSLSATAGSSRHWSDIALPLGISFFTFTQIAYLVDLQQGAATRQDFASYLLFVTFFPHLIAGPILHHKEMMPQFQQDRHYRLSFGDMTVGLSWFIMGLGKKVLLADTFAHTANGVFGLPTPVPLGLAWRGALCYALQLYFDFSGYSDMALGLARMFSIDFPLNFSSPYKSKNIISFWQRWHITLSSYIMAYIFTPLQLWISKQRQAAGKKVSRKALATPGGFASMVAFPILCTMFLAGIWHGAGLQFIIFGSLHGVYLVVNHAWRILRRQPAADAPERSRLSLVAGHVFAVAFTFFWVVIAHIFFRSRSTGQAVSIIGSLFGLHGSHSGWLLPEENAQQAIADLLFLAVGFVIVWAMPNTQEILLRFKPALQVTPWDTPPSFEIFRWSPRLGWSVALGLVFFLALIHLQDPATFLYFQF